MNFIILFIIFFLSSYKAYCTSNLSLPAILKADRIENNLTKDNNIINAVGNVELKKDNNILFSDILSYDKNSQNINAQGNIKIINYDIGNVLAKTANVKSDFKSGEFSDATIIFHDGSYIKSPIITRISESETIFNTPVFSVCPNDEIKDNNAFVDTESRLFSISSQKTTINKLDNSIVTKDGIIRFYDFPVFYTPYLKTSIPSRERKSGFLYPTYLNNTKLGNGLKIPHYLNIAPDKDLTTTIKAYPINGHFILNNQYRQLTKQGEYNIDLELANNESKTNNIPNYKENTKNVRWKLLSNGSLVLPKDFGVNFKINYVGDMDYLRDYDNQFADYTLSEINFDYIKNKNYISLKTIEIQDLTVGSDGRESLTAFPIINYYNQTTPKNSWLNQTYSLLLNSTVITKKSGAQYHRLSLEPKIKIPYNLNGNLFEFETNLQNNIYNINDNYKNYHNNNDNIIINYRPETSLKWSLPMVSIKKNRTFILEPLITITTSLSNDDDSPNEDSNNTELSQSNLFLNDRFSGFDRSEIGERASYGFKSSLFNRLGEFYIGLGQSWHSVVQQQDVVINGFGNSKKSNIVGNFAYKANKVLSIAYDFQLNESNYRNDINKLSTQLNFDNLRISNQYISITNFDTNKKMKQASFGVSIDVTKNLTLNNNVVNDLITKRTIYRSHSLNYNGCCVIYSVVFSENYPSLLTKADKSYSINFTIRNL
jgi:LPS-assembly protein